MKKIITIIFCLALMSFLVSCKSNNELSTSNNTTSITSNITTSNTSNITTSITSNITTSNTSNNTTSITTTMETTTKMEDEKMNKELKLKIDSVEVSVSWEDNDSVKSLMNLAEDGLEINMSKYGGFEQVGSIGATLPSNDSRITTNPGDIMLYSSNQIVVFYGSNTWAYTKLGHINLTKNELVELLGNKDVKLTINFK